MGNVVPMDSKLLSNYWYMSRSSWPTHISKCVLTKIRAEPPLIFRVSSSTCIQYILTCALGLTTAFKFMQSARASKFICHTSIQHVLGTKISLFNFSRLTIVCKIAFRARRTRPAGQARDDRVSCNKADDVSRRVDIVDQGFFSIC